MNVSHCTAKPWSHQWKERWNIWRHTFTSTSNDLQQFACFQANFAIIVYEECSSCIQQHTNVCSSMSWWRQNVTAQFRDGLETETGSVMAAVLYQFLYAEQTQTIFSKRQMMGIAIQRRCVRNNCDRN